MANPLSSLKTILDGALAIEQAVQDVRQNRKDCDQIKSRVERVRLTLSLCGRNTELTNNTAVSAALEALGRILVVAFEVVTACQTERCFLSRYLTAGKLSKKLRKVDQDILNVNAEAVLAIVAYAQTSRQNQGGAPPPPEPVDIHSSVPANGEIGDQPRSVLHDIAELASKINVALATVRQNKDECVEIDRRVKRVSTLLLEFENTEMMKELKMSGKLEKLLGTFRQAHTLVTDCQKRAIFIIRPAGELSKQLHQVLGKMELQLDDMTDFSVSYAHKMLVWLFLYGTPGNDVTPQVCFGGVVHAFLFFKRLRSRTQRTKGTALHSTGPAI